MATHRAQGQAVVYVEDGHIVAAKGNMVQKIALTDIPLTLGGAIGFQVENAMASIAPRRLGVGAELGHHSLGASQFFQRCRQCPGPFAICFTTAVPP